MSSQTIKEAELSVSQAQESLKRAEKEAASAKKFLQEQRKKDFFEPFLKLKDKAFYFHRSVVAGRNSDPIITSGFVLYGPMTLREVEPMHAMDAADGDRELEVTIKTKTVYATISKADKTYQIVEVKSVKYPCESFRNYDDMAKGLVCEVPLALFKAEFETPTHLAMAMASRWSELAGVRHEPQQPVPAFGDLDIPFIILENNEGSLVGESVFRVDNRYLVTPNSVKLAVQRIEEHEEVERRCAGHYQECDRAYLEGRVRDISSLKRKLNIS